MSATTPERAPRYRRRILFVGAAATFVLYVVGAPIFVNQIEADLEQRVPEELADAGFGGITAEFSGQDGVLTCDGPLERPDDAIAAAYGVWGVHQIELERSCRVNRAPVVSSTVPSDETGDDAAGDGGTAITDDSLVTSAEVSPATTEPVTEFATIAAFVGDDPQFSLLALLSGDSELAAELADPDAGPFTLFAPSDEVLEAVPADVIALLSSDPELLDQILAHHVVDGRHSATELADAATPDGAELIARDGAALAVEVVDGELVVGGAPIVEADVATGNGTVHVVGGLMLPDGVDLDPPAQNVEVAATFVDGELVLTGAVATEAERGTLLDAAGEVRVVDELEVDPDLGLDAAGTAALAGLVAAVPEHLVRGEVRVDGADVAVTGAYETEAGRDAMLAAAAEVGATTDLTPRADADDDDAADLETIVNDAVADDPITFEPNSATLSPDAAEVIDRVARAVRQYGGLAIVVEGHTDSDGTASTNLALSQRRAEAVVAALVELGVDEASITAVGFGQERPVVIDGVEDREASRRVEFRITAT